MLGLNNIKRSYIIGSDIHRILKGVTIKFKKGEFVSIIGPSGAGKTTLLNIIGGLETYDSGEIIINGVSSRKFEDGEWAAYRNYNIGFIFKEHNLIMHETILHNVLLGLMSSKLSKKEKKEKAIEALDKVGLKDYINKRPNELSAVQMKKVSIARAIISNPDIILADEPNGMLSSKDSLEIINILKSLSKEKLVIITTNDHELARENSTRVIEMKDGMITADNSQTVKEKKRGRKKKEDVKEVEENNTIENRTYKSSISMTNALSLSLNSLLMRRGKTFLTVLVSSFGIVFIALIVSLFIGVSNYAKKIETNEIANYPIRVEKYSYDLYQKSLLEFPHKVKCDNDKVCSYDNLIDNKLIKDKVVNNNLKEFKSYISKTEKFNEYTNNITYSYDIEPQVYTKDYKKVNPSNIKDEVIFKEMNINTSKYNLIAGEIPDDYHELMLVIGRDRNISDSLLYALNIKDRKILAEDINKFLKDSSYDIENKIYNYDEILNQEYRLLLNTDYYVEEKGVFIDHSNDVSYIKSKINNATKLKIVGIAIDDNASTSYIGYLYDLTLSLRYKISNTALYKKQIANKKINVLTGEEFDGINSTYDKVTKKLGIYEETDTLAINIYPKDAESKKQIIRLIEEYNDEKKSDGKEKMMITYTDTMKSKVKSINNNIIVVSCALGLFAIVGIIISSVIVKVSTYENSLYRAKEFSVLRVFGASRKDIKKIIIAETMIKGLFSSIIGVGISMLIAIPINIFVSKYFMIEHISSMSIIGFIILIIVNIILFVIAGLGMASKGSKKNLLEVLSLNE